MSLLNSQIFYDLFFIFIFSTVFYIVDILTEKNNYKKCRNDPYTMLYLYFHHFINTFLWFGWLCGSPYLLIVYIITVGVIVSLWKIVGRCLMTVHVNRKCDIPVDEYFNDIIKLVGIKKLALYKQINYTTLAIFVSIAVYRVSISPLFQ